MAEEKGPQSQEPDDQSKLSETLSSEKGLAGIAKGREMLTEATSSKPPPPREAMGSVSEVGEATEKLTGAVDQMVSPLLLALGLLDSAVKWLKLLTAGVCVATALIVFIAVRIEMASSAAQAASKEVSEAKQAVKDAREELTKANGELKQVRDDLLTLKAEAAKQAVDQASQPKIVPGDRPGEVAIVTPAIAPRDIEKAKKAAEQAVKAGKEPPPLPEAGKATKIPAQLKPAEVEELNDAFKKK